MKKTALFPALLLSAALAAQQPAQVTVQGDAKVGLIVTGTGNTINTTQIFGKSPEYAELKKRLDGLETAIGEKANECEQMRRDSLPARYRDNCRAELIALNAGRDSVQKIETRFREDVIRLAETFASIPLNSERLRLAKQLFEEGKIREADNVLNTKEMKNEGEALLAEKTRTQEKLQKTDSLLRVKADEFALKAQLKATDYADSLRYDSAVLYFEQSRRYAETVGNLRAFANLLLDDNQTLQAITYYEKALQLARLESEEAALANNLGDAYSRVQKMAESEKMYLRALEIRERLAKSDSAEFEPDLAITCRSLGAFYHTNRKMVEAEKLYLRALEICERLVRSNPVQFEPALARVCMNLGIFYSDPDVRLMTESEKLYLRALDIYERLAKSNPTQFEPGLAKACRSLGNFNRMFLKRAESEKLYLWALEICERLAKSNPLQFEPDLAKTCMDLGDFYLYYTDDDQKMAESEKMYLRSLDICERLAKSNPAQFEPDLAKTCMGLGEFYSDIQKTAESVKMYLRALEIWERLVRSNPAQFEPALAGVCMHLGYFYADGKMAESEKMCLRALEIYKRLVQNNSALFKPKLVDGYGILSWVYVLEGKYAEAASAGEKALALDTSQTWVNGNLGHSHLLRGDWDKAKQAYEQYIAGEQDPAEAKATLLQDWDALEAAGAIPQERMGDVEKARAWAGKQ